MTVRIAKFLADTGAASRRYAECLIKSGAVAVNGVKIDTPVFFVDGTEKITVSGKVVLNRKTAKLYAFNKPINTMTTARDPAGRRTIYDVLPARYKNLKYIGRLDYKTTGLLLLTNDGDLARKLTLPSSNIPRVYVASVSGSDFSRLDSARRGIVINGVKYRPMTIDVQNNNELRITITEGKKNEIRIVLAHLGLPVKKLHRISYGPVKLGNLSVGEIIEIGQKIIDLMSKYL
ncbi:MAG: rRNA pseudouridine synthase [Rickettsiales bacterium]|jgi:23S rRNA pseudouridine2605 synthase|nr:rRNA pseudouridine synthase [Rickettsiales bacterium]